MAFALTALLTALLLLHCLPSSTTESPARGPPERADHLSEALPNRWRPHRWQSRAPRSCRRCHLRRLQQAAGPHTERFSVVRRRHGLPQPRPGHPYYLLTNAELKNGTVYAYLDPASPTTKFGSFKMQCKPDYTVDRNLTVRMTPRDPQSPDQLSCSSVAPAPAIVFFPPFANNVFHLFNDGFIPMYQTLAETGLLPEELIGGSTRGQAATSLFNWSSAEGVARELCRFEAAAAASDVTLLSWDPHPYNYRWSFLFDYLSRDKRLLQHADDICFETLVLGASPVLEWYANTEDWPEQHLEARMTALQGFQRFVGRAALLHELQVGQHPPAEAARTAAAGPHIAPPLPLICSAGPEHVAALLRTAGLVGGPGGSRPVVTFASRPTGETQLSRGGLGRSIRNEDDIAAYIQRHYDVSLQVTHFDGSPWQTFALMQRTDVLLGMHGAGWTNAMFLKRGAVALQLFPYGWETEPNRFIRGGFYSAMVEAVGGTHLAWANRNPEHAFFRRADFERAGKGEVWVEHPRADDPTPQVWNPPWWWTFQTTYVDMATFGPALDAAMRAAGIPKRGIV